MDLKNNVRPGRSKTMVAIRHFASVVRSWYALTFRYSYIYLTVGGGVKVLFESLEVHEYGRLIKM